MKEQKLSKQTGVNPEKPDEQGTTKLSMMKKSVLLFVSAILMVIATSCTKKTTYEIYNGTSGIGIYDVNDCLYFNGSK